MSPKTRKKRRAARDWNGRISEAEWQRIVSDGPPEKRSSIWTVQNITSHVRIETRVYKCWSKD